MKRISRYYHTIKPLKLEQILYRLKYRFFSLKSLSAQSSENLSAKRWSLSNLQAGEQSLFENSEVCFLNKKAYIITPQDWHDESQHSKLWLYNLHYFNDLNSVGGERRYNLQKKFILKWIKENPPLNGNGWEPYPISLRLVNWIKWCQFNQEYSVDILCSIEQQADALMRQLEFHILGNHLFANAKALVFAGSFLNSDRANDYISKGLELLKREVLEQFMADGGHFELSPMYHCILLWDLIDLYNLALACDDARFNPRLSDWADVIGRGLRWLSVMCHPDGGISFFNDAAFGIAPSPKEIFSFAALVGIVTNDTNLFGLSTLESSGYSRLQRGSFTLFFDHAEVGPSYLPGHAHADSLSIELSLGRQRIFVNSGTSEYGEGPERQRQRSTPAHNTLFVKDKNSSDVWAGFRVGRRAQISGVEFEATQKFVSARAQHDGYCHFKKGLTHVRTCKVFDDKVLIKDELGASSTNTVMAHFHLHPDVEAEVIDTRSVRLILVSGDTLLFSTDVPVRLEETTWHPEFGKSVPTTRIVLVVPNQHFTSELTLA